MTPLDAMKQALEALETNWAVLDTATKQEAITNLRAAIKAMEDAEPVAKKVQYGVLTFLRGYHDLPDGTLLYTAPVAPESELANETFAKIVDWCRAYPVDVFVEPDWDEVKEKLGPTLLSQVSAANFRHVLKGIEQIIIGAQGVAMQSEYKP